MSFIFLKCIDTYIYDDSIAFSLNTRDEYSLSHCGFEKAFRAEHAPELSIITATGRTIGQYSPLTKRFSPTWTSLTVYTRIDAHKQTDSAILHLFTTLP